jgi:hypothetical protein
MTTTAPLTLDRAALASDLGPHDGRALDAIAHMLRDPDWGAGMLEDIAELVTGTGRSTTGTDEPTWDRH